MVHISLLWNHIFLVPAWTELRFSAESPSHRIIHWSWSVWTFLPGCGSMSIQTQYHTMDSNTGWSSQVLATLSTTDVSSNIHSFLAFALDAWTADSKASAPGSVWPYYIIEPNFQWLGGLWLFVCAWWPGTPMPNISIIQTIHWIMKHLVKDRI